MTDIFKTSILESLAKAFINVENTVPMSKIDITSVDVSELSPLDIVQMMERENIPSTAFLSGKDNGYDGWECGTIHLCWEVQVPTTKDEKLKYKRDRFPQVAWHIIYKTLTDLGFTRRGVPSSLFKEFDDISLYDRYMNKDYMVLYKYYALFFVNP